MTSRGCAILFRTGMTACRKDLMLSAWVAQLSLCSRPNSRCIASLESSCSQHHSRPTAPSRLAKCHRHNRFYSSGTISAKSLQPGFFTKVKSTLGLNHKTRYPRYKMSLSGYCLLRSCAEYIDYEQFFEDFNMPDTFNSWFLIVELHVWLCMVRLSVEGKEGLLVRNNLVDAMWKDIQERAKHLGGSASARRDAIDEMNGHLRASIIAYDEGLLSDDRVLAGALWRVFFEKRDVDPQSLATMVEYVRKQVNYLDSVGPEQILCGGLVTFIPLHEDSSKKGRNRKTGDIE